MKKILALATLVAVGITANAQTLLYQWAFTNSADTFSNSAASYSFSPGTGTLLMANVSGNATGTTGADSINPECYFTNANAGPGFGPGVDAMGAFVANGQSYSGSPTAIAMVTNLNLGTVSQFTITFWVKLGATVGSGGQLPRFVQIYQTPAYDVGGKGSGNHNGVGTSINGVPAGSVKATQEQNGLANNSSAQQNAATITNNPAGNPTLPNGFVTDGATWYFQAITYDGTLTANNFITWIGTLNTNIVSFVQSANYSSINFTTNATIMIGGNDVNATPRSLSAGAIADVRIYSGVCSSNVLEQIRSFQVPSLIPPNPQPATITTQPASGNTFIGGSRAFSVVASGNPSTFTYLWRSNGVALSDGTNASLVLNSLTATANGATFICSVTNLIGGTNSTAATLSVSSPLAGSYAQAAYANNPYSFWEVNESTNTAGITVIDYANGHDGSVPNPVDMFFVTGPANPTDTGFPSTNTAIQTRPNIPSKIDLADPVNFPNTGMTICGWINTPGLLSGAANANGLIFDLVSDTGGGFGLQAAPNDGTHNQLGYQWGQTSVACGLYFSTNEWTFITLTISTNLTQADLDNSIAADTNAMIYVGSPSLGFQAFTNSTALNGTLMPSGTSASPLALGRTTVGFSENGPFVSVVNAQFNSVAVYYQALSYMTVTNLYAAGGANLILTLNAVPDPNTAGNLLLTWPLGTLQESTNVAGPYTDVSGPPSSPDSVQMTDPQHFYRVRQ